MSVTVEQLKKLRETPLNIRWRVQEFAKKPMGKSSSKPYATCVGYSNIQDVYDHFDNIIGAGNWQTAHIPGPDNMLILSIGVFVDGAGWVYKGDTGSPGVNDKKSLGDKHKSLMSDAFKRAAVLWGVGRYNYFLPRITVDADKWKEEGWPSVVDENGSRVYDLTTYINTSPKYKKKVEAAVANYLATAIDPDDERAGFSEEDPLSKESFQFRKDTLSALLAETAPAWTEDTVKKYIAEKLKVSLEFEELSAEQQDAIIAAVQDYRDQKKAKEKEKGKK